MLRRAPKSSDGPHPYPTREVAMRLAPLALLIVLVLALSACAGGPSVDYAGVTEVRLVEDGREFRAVTGKQYGSLDLAVARDEAGRIVSITLKARSVEAFTGQQIAADMRSALADIVRRTVAEAFAAGGAAPAQ